MDNEQGGQIDSSNKQSSASVCCVAQKYHNWCNDVGQEIYVQHKEQKFCLFHAPLESQEKRVMWDDNKFVFNRIDHSKKNNVRCDLSGTIFPCNISFWKKDLPPINFNDAVFNMAANFNDATFLGKADFSQTSFNGEVDFSNALFNGNADFSLASFLDIVAFRQTSFNGEINFVQCAFKNSTFFIEANFAQKSSFIMASFDSIANFIRTEFNNETSFNLATFGGMTFFDEAKFNKDTSFRMAIFKQSFHFAPKVLNSSSFDFCKPTEIIEFDQTDLRKMHFVNAPINRFRFISCQWPETHGRKTIYDARQVDSKGYFELTNVENPTPYVESDPPGLGLLEDLFQQLKKNAKADHNEMLASDWHYNEAEVLRLKLQCEVEATSYWHSWQRAFDNIKNLGISKIIQPRWWRSFFLYQIVTAYKHCSGYGEEPLRGFLCLLALIFLPVLMQIPETIIKFIPFLPSWELFPGDAMDYIPLARQKIDPSGHWLITRLCMTFWQVLISVQAALFGFALRNRFRR